MTRANPSAAKTDGLRTIDSQIARTAERINTAQRSLDKHRTDYADLIALRTVFDKATQ